MFLEDILEVECTALEKKLSFKRFRRSCAKLSDHLGLHLNQSILNIDFLHLTRRSKKVKLKMNTLFKNQI
jgi:hypothetical protein